MWAATWGTWWNKLFTPSPETTHNLLTSRGLKWFWSIVNAIPLLQYMVMRKVVQGILSETVGNGDKYEYSTV